MGMATIIVTTSMTAPALAPNITIFLRICPRSALPIVQG
jgi:hypothetical protein